MAVYRKGYANATGPERRELMRSERLARSTALQEESYEAARDARIGFVDCADLRVSGSKVDWFRTRGKLFIRIRVALQPGNRIRVYRWRSAVRRGTGTQLPAIDTRRLDRYRENSYASQRRTPRVVVYPRSGPSSLLRIT